MSDIEESAAEPALGADLEEAVKIVLEREPEADPETVRSTLERVAEDGIVCEEGINSALGDVAQHVATPENRIESTEESLDAGREAAVDLDIANTRLEALEACYRDRKSDVDELVSRLDEFVERGRQPEDVYDLARSIEALKWDLRDIHGDVESLRADLESFEQWATDPAIRYDELEGDVAHVEKLLDGLEQTAGRLESVDGADETELGNDPAVTWADAALQRRMLDLLVADLRAELSDLRTWADRDGSTTSREDGDDGTARADAIEARIDYLQSRERRLKEHLDTLAGPQWRERIGDRIEAFEADIEAFDPPVQWEQVELVLQDHRSALQDGS